MGGTLLAHISPGMGMISESGLFTLEVGLRLLLTLAASTLDMLLNGTLVFVSDRHATRSSRQV
jgi:hypothetical protein